MTVYKTVYTASTRASRYEGSEASQDCLHARLQSVYIGRLSTVYIGPTATPATVPATPCNALPATPVNGPALRDTALKPHLEPEAR